MSFVQRFLIMSLVVGIFFHSDVYGIWTSKKSSASSCFLFLSFIFEESLVQRKQTAFPLMKIFLYDLPLPFSICPSVSLFFPPLGSIRVSVMGFGLNCRYPPPPPRLTLWHFRLLLCCCFFFHGLSELHVFHIILFSRFLPPLTYCSKKYRINLQKSACSGFARI